jgi:hypothetical protein
MSQKQDISLQLCKEKCKTHSRLGFVCLFLSFFLMPVILLPLPIGRDQVGYMCKIWA